MPTLAAVGTVAAALVAFGFGGCDDKSSATATDEATGAVRQAADDADRLSTASGYPFATSLANQLHLRTPEQEYEALSSPAQVPSQESIGVYATASTLWLSKRVPGGLVVQLRRVKRGPARGTYGPTVVTPSGLADGDFVTPIKESWTTSVGPSARVTRDSAVSASTPASLRIDGTGRRGRVPTLVYQVVQNLASRAAGTVYTVNLVARARNLSRPLAVETKLDYRDGSYEFFVAAPQGKQGIVGGVPKGRVDVWLPLESRAVARKDVAQVTVYAADAGVAPLRGSAWIDDITLAVSRP
jgi:hypothetical protein